MSALRERMSKPGELDTRSGKVFAPMRGMSVRVASDGCAYCWWTVIDVYPEGMDLANGASTTGTLPTSDVTHIDTSDPATIGCMWAQVETRYPGVMMERRGNDGSYWHVVDLDGRRIASGRSPAAAMVTAMSDRKPGL